MIELSMLHNENIILQQTDAYWHKNKVISLDEIILTNQRIILGWNEKEGGLFSKSIPKTESIYLSDIKFSNGVAQVSVIEIEDYEYAVQITTDTRYLFSFESANVELDCKKWADSIRTAIDSNASKEEDIKDLDNREPSRFCIYCGKQLSMPDATFCIYCGSKLDE